MSIETSSDRSFGDVRDYRQAAVSETKDLLAGLKSGSGGLSSEERRHRLADCGLNETTVRQTTAWGILLRQFRSPFVYLLAGAVAVALYAGEYVDAGLIAVFVLINTALSFYQEYRAEQAVRLLRGYWRYDVTVLVDGQPTSVGSERVVPGDVLRLAAGDRIPADVRFMSADSVTVDESMLTGESVHVEKSCRTASVEPQDYFDAGNVGFAGTSLLSGEALAVVFATGRHSSLGLIVGLAGRSASSGVFEREIGSFSRFILKMVGVTLLVIFLLNVVLRGWGNLDQMLLFFIALTIGVVPEALPVVMTVTHTRAALRLAAKKVIVKRLSAVDDLGSVDVLCIDKTGTVTRNELEVSVIMADDPERCVILSLVGSPAAEGCRSVGNSFDRALRSFAGQRVAGEAARYRQVAELPFDPDRRRGSVLVEDPDGGRRLVVRGSPDEVLELCGRVGEPIELGRWLEREGLAGRRVLVVAERAMSSGCETVSVEDETGLEFVGALSFEDPLKDGAAAAIHKAGQMRIQIKMLTGDAREVAGAVAEQLGLVTDPSEVITGHEFDALDAGGQVEAVGRFVVFARVNPEQKFRIISLLQQAGRSVGFLGEGFNDVPALRLADVGIAVENAADVAKDAADIILGDASLSAIVDGAEIGRRNFANVIKYLTVTLAANFGNFYSVAIVSLLVPFLPMLPVQILLLNLLTDAPMITVAADAAHPSELRRPNHYDARQVILMATVLGVVSSAFDFLTFGVFHGLGAEPLRTLWFMESALTEILLIFSVRTAGPFYRGPRIPPSVSWIMGVMAVVCLVLPYTGWGHRLFGFVSPHPWQLAAVLAIVAVYFCLTELVKLRFFGRKRAYSGDR